MASPRLLLGVESGRRVLFQPGQGPQGLPGGIDPRAVEAAQVGDELNSDTEPFLVLAPNDIDRHATLRRKAQIITPKDLGPILWELAVEPGDIVFESGIGSGAATLALANRVGSDGRVLVQELREDFRDHALGNVARAGFEGRVVCTVGDLTQGLDPELARQAGAGIDAVLLDQPEPWLALPHLLEVLKAGARIVNYSPNVAQMQAFHLLLEQEGFQDVRSFEVMVRDWEVGQQVARPKFEGLGHTAFLTRATWLGGAL